MNRRLMLLIGLLLSGTILLSAQQDGSSANMANLHKQNRMPPGKFLRATDQKKRVVNQYIVVLTDAAAGPRGKSSRAPLLTDLMVRMHGAHLLHQYSDALNGFAAQMSEEEARRLSEEPEVAYVEEDQQVELSTSWESNPDWGLDRIDQRSLPLNRYYGYNYTGYGVRVYVIDTGIYTGHPEFGGRAINVFDAFGGNGQDCYGHGTHVAGIIGGVTYGVAKQAMLRGVKVFTDCLKPRTSDNTNSSIIAGVNFVTAHHVKPAVANMSLVSAIDYALDTAVTNMAAAGVTVVVAAGNGDANGIPIDACNTSPARAPGTITVGAIDINDIRASFSNYGPCLELFAPGVDIMSASITGSYGILMSGTSMASPHVAGAAALYLQQYPWASRSSVRNALVNTATPGMIWYAGPASPNKLLYSWFTY
jgi:subtilisin family serine protease